MDLALLRHAFSKVFYCNGLRRILVGLSVEVERAKCTILPQESQKLGRFLDSIGPIVCGKRSDRLQWGLWL